MLLERSELLSKFPNAHVVWLIVVRPVFSRDLVRLFVACLAVMCNHSPMLEVGAIRGTIRRSAVSCAFPSSSIHA